MIREEVTNANVYADELCFVLQFSDSIDTDKLYMQAKLEEARFKEYLVDACVLDDAYFDKDKFRLNMTCRCTLEGFIKILDKGFLNGILLKTFQYHLTNSAIDDVVNNYCSEFKDRCKKTYEIVEKKDVISVELLELTTKDIDVKSHRLSEFDFETTPCYKKNYVKDAVNIIEIRTRVDIK